jgi:hypothetical protein
LLRWIHFVDPGMHFNQVNDGREERKEPRRARNYTTKTVAQITTIIANSAVRVKQCLCIRTYGHVRIRMVQMNEHIHNVSKVVFVRIVVLSYAMHAFQRLLERFESATIQAPFRRFALCACLVYSCATWYLVHHYMHAYQHGS